MDKPHLKKLDDRSRILVHLGTEPGSKAYRLFDPQTKKIVVSRDVVFDETKGWNWTHSDGDGSFSIASGDLGNHERIENEETEQIEEAATGNAKIRADREELVASTAEAESTAAVLPDNVIAEEMIVREQDEQSDLAEEIGAERQELTVGTTEAESTASTSPENVVAEETLSQGTEKRNETTEEISACVENEESGDVLLAESEKEELSIEEDDDDWEGIERSELEIAFVAASNLLADVPGSEQKADILTKALGRIKFKEMREFIGVQDLSKHRVQA